jgi:phenylpyruvate tautomerase PptA (4-oxalocrotonate tautomerase family)
MEWKSLVEKLSKLPISMIGLEEEKIYIILNESV